jgi:hypothetical protein
MESCVVEHSFSFSSYSEYVTPQHERRGNQQQQKKQQAELDNWRESLVVSSRFDWLFLVKYLVASVKIYLSSILVFLSGLLRVVWPATFWEL